MSIQHNTILKKKIIETTKNTNNDIWTQNKNAENLINCWAKKIYERSQHTAIKDNCQDSLSNDNLHKYSLLFKPYAMKHTFNSLIIWRYNSKQINIYAVKHRYTFISACTSRYYKNSVTFTKITIRTYIIYIYISIGN